MHRKRCLSGEQHVGIVEYFKKVIYGNKNKSLPRIKAGFLLMEENMGWHRFVVVLVGSNRYDVVLEYYRNPIDRVPFRRVALETAVVDVLEEMVMVVTKEDTMFLCAVSEQEAEEWANAICDVLESDGMDRNNRRRMLSRVTKEAIGEIQNKSVESRILEFKEMFVLSEKGLVIKQAAKGALVWSCMRGIAWKIWLNIVPMTTAFADFEKVLSAERNRYAELSVAYTIRELDRHLDCSEPEVNSMMEDGEAQLLLHSICKDVRRTRASMPYFRNRNVQKIMARILYVYSMNHSNVSYNQGMSELVAVVMYLLHVECWPEIQACSVVSVTSPCKPFRNKSTFDMTSKIEDAEIHSILSNISDSNYIEHDTYLVFEAMMIRMSDLYCPTRRASISLTTQEDFSFRRTTFHAKLQNIHEHILPRCDPQLSKHFHNLGIEAHMYLLRWVRLLMCREFPMYHTWHLWDSIFSLSSVDFHFIDYLCVATVRFYRIELLQHQDTPSILLNLRNISDTIPIDRLVEEAKHLMKNMQLASSIEVQI